VVLIDRDAPPAFGPPFEEAAVVAAKACPQVRTTRPALNRQAEMSACQARIQNTKDPKARTSHPAWDFRLPNSIRAASGVPIMRGGAANWPGPGDSLLGKSICPRRLTHAVRPRNALHWL
jgi:hypothetical protein